MKPGYAPPAANSSRTAGETRIVARRRSFGRGELKPRVLPTMVAAQAVPGETASLCFSSATPGETRRRGGFPPPARRQREINDMPTFNGTPGDDTLVGTSGDDDLHGFDGNDVLSGLAGQRHARRRRRPRFHARQRGQRPDLRRQRRRLSRRRRRRRPARRRPGIDRATFAPSATAGVTVDLNIQGVAQNTGQGIDTLIGIEHLSGTALRRHADRRRRRQLAVGRLGRHGRHRQRHHLRRWRQRPDLGRHRQPHSRRRHRQRHPLACSATRPTSPPPASPSRSPSRAPPRTPSRG